MSGYDALVEFPNGTREFVLGFEAGKLWEQLQWAVAHGEQFEQTFHADNAEVVLRMCDRLEVEHRAEIVDENWMPSDSMYRTVVADPPWTPSLGSTWATRFSDKARPQAHYETMALDSIKALDVPAADQSHLWLWALAQHIDWGWDTARAWGFEPVTTLTWCKPGLGAGRFQCNTEHIILARKGPRHGNPFEQTGGTWFNWPRSDHSTKPDAFYDLVERVSPGPYLELFARRKRLGWDAWGNEIDPDVEIAA